MSFQLSEQIKTPREKFRHSIKYLQENRSIVYGEDKQKKEYIKIWNFVMNILKIKRFSSQNPIATEMAKIYTDGPDGFSELELFYAGWVCWQPYSSVVKTVIIDSRINDKIGFETGAVVCYEANIGKRINNGYPVTVISKEEKKGNFFQKMKRLDRIERPVEIFPTFGNGFRLNKLTADLLGVWYAVDERDMGFANLDFPETADYNDFKMDLSFPEISEEKPELEIRQESPQVVLKDVYKGQREAHQKAVQLLGGIFGEANQKPSLKFSDFYKPLDHLEEELRTLGYQVEVSELSKVNKGLERVVQNFVAKKVPSFGSLDIYSIATDPDGQFVKEMLEFVLKGVEAKLRKYESS